MPADGRRLAALAAIILAIWSAVFAPTYHYPFFWDDYHCIRSYTTAELASTFHGWDDPDHIETPALRPVVALLFASQGAALGEHVVLHRILLTTLMWLLLFVVGLLLSDLGCSLIQIAVVFVLFVFSRAFATVNLWIILSSLVLSYIFIFLALRFFLRWLTSGSIAHLSFMSIAALLAMFTREEAYILSAAALLIWVFTPNYRASTRRAVIGSAIFFGLTILHAVLRRIFVPEAPAPKLTAESLENFWVCLKSSWLPTGQHTVGFTDTAITNVWVALLFVVLLAFVRIGRMRKIGEAGIACAFGVLACTPSVAVAHSYGLTIPTLAFMTALAIALTEVYQQVQMRETTHPIFRYAMVAVIVAELVVGVGGGIRRSYYVSESLHQNCALKILFDATFVFDMSDKPTTVPPERKAAERARLATGGISSTDDIHLMFRRCGNYWGEYVENRETHALPFMPRYAYSAY